ncbi:hypothetical protein Tco_0057873, partial [Tanacetum coccineum]
VLDDGEVLSKNDVYAGLCGFNLVHSDGKAAGNVDFLPEERGSRPSRETKYDLELDTVKEKINTKAENVKELNGKWVGMRSGTSLRELLQTHLWDIGDLQVK